MAYKPLRSHMHAAYREAYQCFTPLVSSCSRGALKLEQKTSWHSDGSQVFASSGFKCLKVSQKHKLIYIKDQQMLRSVMIVHLFLTTYQREKNKRLGMEIIFWISGKNISEILFVIIYELKKGMIYFHMPSNFYCYYYQQQQYYC